MKPEQNLMAVLRLQRKAWDSYTGEFNPGRKIKAPCDWALMNAAWLALDMALAAHEKKT